MTNAGLIASAGALRDGIAAIENLGQLLRSRRVGPRSLSGGLPGLQEGTAALTARIEAFAAAAAAELRDDDAGAALQRVCTGAATRLAELERAIAGADPRTARGRLALEASVQALQTGLPELLVLADLLAAAASPRPVTVVLADALSVRWRDSTAGELPTRDVRVGADSTITADPAVLGPLIEMALGIVSGAPRPVELIVSHESAAVRLRLRPADGQATAVPGQLAPLAVWSADAVTVAKGAARAAGIGVEVEGSAVALVIRSA